MDKIIAITLTLASRGSDLKLDMLEAVDTIATDGRIYRWEKYVVDMERPSMNDLKKWAESSSSPPSSYGFSCTTSAQRGVQSFQEPSRFHMWRFKPFSQRGTLQELEHGKVLLEN